MKKSLMKFGALGALGALLAVAPGKVSAADDYEANGRWFGGTDVGVMQPLNALDRYVSTGGMIAPFVGYKFFRDKDLQLNLGLVGQLQFFGGGADACNGCVRGQNDNATYGLGYTAGPRLSLPVGPTELYGQVQGGGLSGLGNSPSALSGTAGGFLAGGGVNYALTDMLSLGLFANWNRFYQDVHGVGNPRYVNTGLEVLVQEPLEAPPAPVAQVPPPPPPPAPMKKKIVLRGVNFDFDKSVIRPVDEPVLEEACKTLKAEPNINVAVNGYTDLVGTEAHNLPLSQRRADAVRNWFTGKNCGISPSRLTAKGFGMADPVEKTKGPSLQNRRVELIVK